MTLLVLNRRQILSRIPDWLRDIDDDLVVITARSAVPRGRADGIAGYRQLVVVDDNAYNDASTGNLIVEVARKFRVDRILSTAEVDVVRTAKARAILSLKGQTLASAVAYRNKYKMKSIAGAAGIEVAPMAIVRCAYDMVSFAEVYGLPFVLKPLDGGGSAGVRVIRNHHDIAQVAWNVENDKSQYLLAEAWLEGDFFTVDGLMASGQVLQHADSMAPSTRIFR